MKSTRITRRRRRVHTPLRSTYGAVRLPKGTRLYYGTSTPFYTLPESPMLFTTLHPSESSIWWSNPKAHIAVFELQTDIDILFMVYTIRMMRIFSALSMYLPPSANNWARKNAENVKQWIPLLAREGLRGWISSFDNKTAVEIAIVNDPAIVSLVECLPLRYSWRNVKCNSRGDMTPKHWGDVYPVLRYPVTLFLHSRFKPEIETYIESIARDDPRGTAFSLLLENASIKYHDAPISEIRWPTV